MSSLHFLFYNYSVPVKRKLDLATKEGDTHPSDTEPANSDAEGHNRRSQPKGTKRYLMKIYISMMITSHGTLIMCRKGRREQENYVMYSSQYPRKTTPESICDVYQKKI